MSLVAQYGDTKFTTKTLCKEVMLLLVGFLLLLSVWLMHLINKGPEAAGGGGAFVEAGDAENAEPSRRSALYAQEPPKVTEGDETALPPHFRLPRGSPVASTVGGLGASALLPRRPATLVHPKNAAEPSEKEDQPLVSPVGSSSNFFFGTIILCVEICVVTHPHKKSTLNIILKTLWKCFI